MKTFLSLLFFVQTAVFAQVTISFPANRSIFQRNQSNGAVIPISGSYQRQVDRIDARLIPISGGNAVDWTPIAVNPNFGTFIGGIYANGGWYKLEIRAMRGGNILGTSSLEKVGVGEVFIISGQSNAQGYEGSGKAAADDRVNCISNYYSYGEIAEPPFPFISQLTGNVKIAPLGRGAWCWGRLGDLLAQKLNVPILFINTAYEAMGIEDWSKSADGERGFNYYTGNYERPGYPFENLKKSLHYYANMFGIRTILWHQGETDNDKRTGIQKYREALEYLIFRSRGETGKNISWMISKVSRVRNGTYQPVIDAQNLVIQNYPNVFAGPDTDQITDRSDGVHFEGNSLMQLAESWDNKLDNSFFNNSNPLPAAFPLFFYLYCNLDNKDKPLRIFMPDGFKSYYWTNGSTELNNSAIIETGTGYYRGKAIDYLGNVYYTPEVNYSSLAIPEKPNLSIDGSTSFCEGGSVRLISSVDANITWSNGDYNQSIVVNQPGYYSVSLYNHLGCSSVSDGVEVSILPKPEVRITADGNTTFCSDKTVNLSSNTPDGNSWNNGEIKQTITVNKSGEYAVTARNEFGCENTSPKINITVNPLPEKPIVNADGPTIFCADKSIQLLSNVSNDITWNTGEKTPNVTIANTGEYFVIAKNEFGCENTSNVVPVKVNPLPLKPIISADGPTIFCADKSIQLLSNVLNDITWNTGEKTAKVTIAKTGEYFLTAKNEFGCENNSNVVPVRVNPLPVKPIISADGPTVFCADKSIQLLSNVSNNISWNTGEKTANVTIAKTGEYFLTAKNEFGCENTSNVVPVRVNPLPLKPIITASGPTTFCEGESVTLTATPNEAYLWSNNITSNNQMVKSSATFSVKVIDKNGCISPLSDETSVIVKPVPLGINILQTGTYTLESVINGFYDLKYEWSKDGVVLPNDNDLIKAKETGDYTVRGSLLYQLGGGKTLRCFSAPSASYKFIIDPSNKGLSIFPNPIPNNILNMETLEDHENALVSFYDLRGILIKEETIPKFDSKKVFDMKSMPRGTLLIGVKAKDFNVIKRVFIE